MTSKRYIALLRGVNVGRAKRVAMADLRKLIADLGYADVKSVLNSGNLVFSAPAGVPAPTAAAIEAALVLKVGVTARVLVLDGDELADIIDSNPLLARATDHSRLLTFILGDLALRDRLEPLCEQEWGDDAIALGTRAAYAWCPNGILASPAAAALGKALGDTTTARNWSTLAKLDLLSRASNP